MKRISEEGLKVLESCCDFTCEVYEDKSKFWRSHIFDKLKRSLKFKRDYKIEDNFAYIYYKVSNFDKILDGSIRVLRQKGEIVSVYEHESLNYILHYKLLINNEFVINLELSQTLKQVLLTNDKIRWDRLELPIFICENMVVSIGQNGIVNLLMEKNYDIFEMDYANSSFIKKIFKSFFVNMEVFAEKYCKLEIYYDGKLAESFDECNVNKKIARFLNMQLSLGNITSEDIEFTKKVTKMKEKKVITTLIDFNLVDQYGKFCAGKKTIKIKIDAKKAIYELTNKSKVKIIVTKYETAFNNKTISFDCFVKNILKPNAGNLFIKTVDNPFFIPASLYINSKPLKENSSVFDGINLLTICVKKYNNMFLPEEVCTFSKKKEITILAECIKNEKESGKVYLIRYIYIKKYKEIFRIVYQMKNANFSFGITKIENIVIPEIIYEKCCLILLDEDFDLKNINSSSFKEIYNPWYRKSDINFLPSIFEQIFDSQKYETYALKKDCNIFENEEKVTFLEKQKLSFFNLLINKQYCEILLKEELDELLKHYKKKKTFFDVI